MMYDSMNLYCTIKVRMPNEEKVELSLFEDNTLMDVKKILEEKYRSKLNLVNTCTKYVYRDSELNTTLKNAGLTPKGILIAQPYGVYENLKFGEGYYNNNDYGNIPLSFGNTNEKNVNNINLKNYFDEKFQYLDNKLNKCLEMLQAILSKTPYLNMDDEYFTESSHPNKNGDVFKKRKRPKFTDSF